MQHNETSTRAPRNAKKDHLNGKQRDGMESGSQALRKGLTTGPQRLLCVSMAFLQPLFDQCRRVHLGQVRMNRLLLFCVITAPWKASPISIMLLFPGGLEVVEWGVSGW